MAYESVGLLVLRLVIGGIFLTHGLPKLKSPQSMAKGMRWSVPAVVLLGLVESLSALAVMLGLFAQIGAVLLALVMLGALYYKMFVWKVPFTTMKSTGWEFDLLLFASAVLIVLFGAGNIAVQTVL